MLRGCEFFVICTVYADRLMDVSPGHSTLSDVRHTKSQRTNDEKFTASECCGRRLLLFFSSDPVRHHNQIIVSEQTTVR